MQNLSEKNNLVSSTMAAFGLSGHWKNVMPMLMKPATEFESESDDKSHTRAPLRTDSFGFQKTKYI